MTEMCRRDHCDILNSYYWIYVQLAGVNTFFIYCTGRVERYICKIIVKKIFTLWYFCILVCDNQRVRGILRTVELLRYFVILEVLEVVLASP